LTAPTLETLAEIFAFYPNTRPDDHLSVGAHIQVLREHIDALTSQNAKLREALERAIGRLTRYEGDMPSANDDLRAALASATAQGKDV
jgi:hypothetical protein